LGDGAASLALPVQWWKTMSKAPRPERRRGWTSQERERIAELQRRWKESSPEDIREQLRDERSESNHDGSRKKPTL
jgi:hypothetical protein